MTESLHAYMKVGIVHFMAFPQTITGTGPIEETVRAIAEDDYFDAIEISWIRDADVRHRVAAMLQTSGLAVAFGAQPILLTQGLNINSLDEAERRTAVEAVKAGIDEANELGARGVGFLSGPYTETGTEAAFDALVRSTGELCSYAKETGDLRIVLEVFDYDIDKKSLIGPADLAKRYAAAVRAEHDNFGLMVDLSHLPLIRETPHQAIMPVKEYLVHAHIGNCVVKDAALPAYGDQHPRFGFPGGENDVRELVEYLQVLKDIGFLNTTERPFLSFEVKPFADEDPVVTIANSKRVLNAAWAQVR